MPTKARLRSRFKLARAPVPYTQGTQVCSYLKHRGRTHEFAIACSRESVSCDYLGVSADFLLTTFNNPPGTLDRESIPEINPLVCASGSL